MGAIDNFSEFFDYDAGLQDLPQVSLSVTADAGHGELWVERILRSGESWPLSRFRALMNGLPADGMRDPSDESSRDYHVAVEAGRWLEDRPVARNGSGTLRLSVDRPEDEEQLAQAIADIVAHCRRLRGDDKGKAERVDYLGRTASKAIACIRANRHAEAPQPSDDVANVTQLRLKDLASPRRWPFFFGGDADGSAEHAFVIEDLIHEDSISLIFGRQGSLKTQFALDLAAHVGSGAPYHGLNVTPGCTVYIANEGSGAIGKRSAGVYLEHPDLPHDALVCVPQAVNLAREDEAAEFAAFLATEVASQLSMPVRMLIYDTLAKSVPGESDSDDAVISLVGSNCRAIARKLAEVHVEGFVPASVLVHHPRKNDESYRGSGALEGDLDTVINIKRSDDQRLEDRLYEVILQKVKDGPIDRTWAYRAALVHVGTTPSGKENYAPVVRYVGEEERVAMVANTRTKGRKLSKTVRQMIELIVRIQARDGRRDVPREVLADSGYLSQIHESGWDLDVPIAGILVESLRDAFYAERSVAVGDRSVSEKDRSAWRRRLESLASSGAAMTWEGWVWLTEHSEVVGDGR